MTENEEFELSLKELEEQRTYYLQTDMSQTVLIKHAKAELVMQQYESCFDSLWKILKKHLNEKLDISQLPNNPDEILKTAHDHNLISSLEQWQKYLRVRNDSSNDYYGVKAKACAFIIPNFIQDAADLYQTMTGHS